MKWVRPNTITGNVAEGNKYFRRHDIENKIWNEISKGNNVLFLAPRRVGKSSIVAYMAKHPIEGLICKYEDIETDETLQEFYKRLINMIHDSLSNVGKSKEWFKKWWDSFTIKNIGKDNVEIGKQDVDFRELFSSLLYELKSQNIKIVLFLDEFPDVVLNIKEKEGDMYAKQLLSEVRTLCHDIKFKNTFTLVLLGSVGLTHVVKKITGRTNKINHLHTEHLPPLEKEQSKIFLQFLIEDATMQVSQEMQEYLLEKIGNYMPYYIQLLIEECDTILYIEKRPELSKLDINEAYNRLIKKNDKFEDWDSRLSKYFQQIYPFLNKVLSICAHKGKLSHFELYDIAVKCNLELQWKAYLDDILVADGYIYEDFGDYCFVSPLLRDWWKSRYPIIIK